MFYEERIGDRLSAWCELVAACRTEGVTTVVVPSNEHFHRTPEVAAFMRNELATTVKGTVRLADEAGTGATGETAAPMRTEPTTLPRAARTTFAAVTTTPSAAHSFVRDALRAWDLDVPRPDSATA